MWPIRINIYIKNRRVTSHSHLLLLKYSGIPQAGCRISKKVTVRSQQRGGLKGGSYNLHVQIWGQKDTP